MGLTISILLQYYLLSSVYTVGLFLKHRIIENWLFMDEIVGKAFMSQT